MQEKASATINIEEQEPEVVLALLEYCYSRDYKNHHPNDISKPALVFDAKVYAIGGFYQITGLQQTAQKRFSDLAHCQNLTLTVKAGLWEAVRFIYGTTPTHDRGMRHVMVEVAMKDFRGRKDFLTDALKVMNDVSEFASDIATTLMTAPLEPVMVRMICEDKKRACEAISVSQTYAWKVQSHLKCIFCKTPFRKVQA